MRYAQIDEAGICYADTILAAECNNPRLIPVAPDAPSPLGKLYNDGQWLAAEAETPIASRVITKLAFRRRLPIDKRVAFDDFCENYMNADLPEDAKKLIRTFLKDLGEAQEVDLDDEGLSAALMMFVQLGVFTSGDMDALLG